MTDAVAFSKLLTIAIPTYNRAQYLDICLSQVCAQTKGRGDNIELLVSNNNSTDDTDKIVEKYIKLGFVIRYIKNEENIGPDRNIAQCFEQSCGRYVLILGDDDVLLDGAIEKIMPALKEDYGVIYLKAYSYNDDYMKERPTPKAGGYSVYRNANAFVRKVNVMFTFISCNIVNKAFVDKDLDIQSFAGTNLIQLSWIFSALARAPKNLIIRDRLIAAKAGNTGGYHACDVFGVKMNKVFDMLEKKGVSRACFNIVNRTLLISFLPSLILFLKKGQGAFHKEDFYETLSPTFKSHPAFWLATYPVIIMPHAIGKIWHKIAKMMLKVCRLFLIWEK